MTQHTCGSNGCGHASDCAVHNEPAMPAGPCKCKGANCGATDGRHSRECIAEAGAAQGWAPTSADYADCGPSRVTPDDIQREIVSEHYFTAAEGVAGEASLRRGLVVVGDTTPPPALGLLTFCVLVLRNGAKAVGVNYGTIDPAQHSAERGREEARAQAVEKVWELLNFRLRDKLAGINDPSKAEQVLGEVLSVVQHYLPPDGGTVHEAMDKIIGLVDPWPLSNRPAGA